MAAIAMLRQCDGQILRIVFFGVSLAVGVRVLRRAAAVLHGVSPSAWLSCLHAPAIGGASKGPTAFSVMSFNLRYDNEQDKLRGHGWEDRRGAVCDLISEMEVDIVGTQEGLLHQLKYLCLHLQDYEYFGEARDRHLGLFPSGEHCALLCRSGSAKPLGCSTFALSETPERCGSKSWGSACPRIATMAWVHLKQSGDGCVLFLNTHLDHRSQPARVKGAELIVARLDELERMGPPLECGRHLGTVVTGDFNCYQRNWEGNPNPCFKIFEEAGFHDACTESGDGQCISQSFHNWCPEAACSQLGSRKLHSHIDWVLWRGSGLQLETFEIITTGGSATSPASDHFPVVARFQLVPKP